MYEKLTLNPRVIIWKFCKFSCGILILLAAIKGLVSPITTYFTQELIDNITEAYSNGTVDWFSIVLPVVMLSLCMLFKLAKDVIEEFIEIQVTNDLRHKYNYTYAEKLSRLKYEIFEDKEKMNIISRVSKDPAANVVSYMMLVVSLVSQIIGSVGIFYLLAKVAWWLFIPVILIFIVVLRLDYASVNGEIKQSHEQTEEARYKGYIESLMSDKSTAKEVRINGLREHLLVKWSDIRTKLQKERYTLYKKERVRNHGFVRLLMFSFNTAVKILFVYWVYIDRMTVGQMVSYSAAISSVLSLAMQSFPETLSNLLSAKVYWKEFAEVESYPEAEEKIETVDFDGSEDSEVVFDDVSFKYPGTDTLILNHMNLAFKLSEKIALVGENGCGKSTLIKLLFGLYEPTKGRITVDGVDLRELTFVQRKVLFSPVFQDSAALFLSIREAIGIADVGQMDDLEAVRISAERGFISEYIESLPDKYDTLLGNIYENGVELSGGQWQRIGIARAHMNQSFMKVLDEPTSSLDPRAENEFYENILRMEQRGILIVTHRLGITSHLDRVVLISDGKVTEDGSHDDLMKRKGLYYRMYESQSKWYSNGMAVSE